MASQTASKMALIFMLLLATVVATHGHKVACKNNCPTPMKANGIEIPVGVIFDIEVADKLELEILDKAGNIVKGSCTVPVDVTALVFLYVDLGIQVKVAAVSNVLGGLIHTLLGLILTVIKCVL